MLVNLWLIKRNMIFKLQTNLWKFKIFQNFEKFMIKRLTIKQYYISEYLRQSYIIL